MDSFKCQSLLAQSLQASVKQLKMMQNFQNDNNPKHKSKSIKECTRGISLTV